MASVHLGLGILLWLAVGMIMGWLHMSLLKRALQRVESLDAQKAAARIARTAPLRLSLWVLPLVAAARTGVVPCLSLLVGLWASRWIVLYYARVHRRSVAAPNR